jgi:hypothetical protein
MRCAQAPGGYTEQALHGIVSRIEEDGAETTFIARGIDRRTRHGPRRAVRRQDREWALGP